MRMDEDCIGHHRVHIGEEEQGLDLSIYALSAIALDTLDKVSHLKNLISSTLLPTPPGSEFLISMMASLLQSNRHRASAPKPETADFPHISQSRPMEQAQ